MITTLSCNYMPNYMVYYIPCHTVDYMKYYIETNVRLHTHYNFVLSSHVTPARMLQGGRLGSVASDAMAAGRGIPAV